MSIQSVTSTPTVQVQHAPPAPRPQTDSSKAPQAEPASTGHKVNFKA